MADAQLLPDGRGRQDIDDAKTVALSPDSAILVARIILLPKIATSTGRETHIVIGNYENLRDGT